MWFDNLSIRSKLFLSFTISGAVLVVASIVGVCGLAIVHLMN
jgi:hypothetical protein